MANPPPPQGPGTEMLVGKAALDKGVSEELYDKVVIPLNLTRGGSADLPSGPQKS